MALGETTTFIGCPPHPSLLSGAWYVPTTDVGSETEGPNSRHMLTVCETPLMSQELLASETV